MSLHTGMPVIFGVLTTDTIECAETKAENRRPIALGAIEMVNLTRLSDNKYLYLLEVRAAPPGDVHGKGLRIVRVDWSFSLSAQRLNG